MLFILTPKDLAVILLPPHPTLLMHKNPQTRKVIHGMHPVGCKDQLIDLNMCICRNIRPVHVISVAVIMAVVMSLSCSLNLLCFNRRNILSFQYTVIQSFGVCPHII